MSEKYPCPKCGGTVAWRKDPCMDAQEHGACRACGWKTEFFKQDWYGAFVPVILEEVKRLTAEVEKLRTTFWYVESSRRLALLQEVWGRETDNAPDLRERIGKEIGR